MPAAPPVIVEVGAGAWIPQVVVDRRQAILGAPGEGVGAGLLALIASMIVVSAYHLGYPEFAGRK